MNKPTLWVMVGLSGSGKSSVAKEIAENNPNTVIVSLNNIREELTGDYENQEHNNEVFKVFHKRISEACKTLAKIYDIDFEPLLARQCKRFITRMLKNLYVQDSDEKLHIIGENK